MNKHLQAHKNNIIILNWQNYVKNVEKWNIQYLMYVKLFYFLLCQGVVHKVSTFYIKLR